MPKPGPTFVGCDVQQICAVGAAQQSPSKTGCSEVVFVAFVASLLCLGIWVVVSSIFIFSPTLGKMSHFDSYFSDGLKPPTRYNFRNKVMLNRVVVF